MDGLKNRLNGSGNLNGKPKAKRKRKLFPDLKVGIYKNGKYHRTTTIEDPRNHFVQSFNELDKPPEGMKLRPGVASFTAGKPQTSGKNRQSRVMRVGIYAEDGSLVRVEEFSDPREGYCKLFNEQQKRIAALSDNRHGGHVAKLLPA